MEERLQKILARAGVCSRRAAEQLIVAGRVSVNGRVARELGMKADLERDEVTLDGNPVRVTGPRIYVLLHKPEGYVTTTEDPEGRPTVMDLVGRLPGRVFPVGRLDYGSAGLLLLTNDGELAQFLTRPRSHVPKTYEVKVRDRIGPDKIKELARGPKIGGPALKSAAVKFLRASRSGRHSWIEVTITEGRTRQIRRMCEAVGHPVIKLKRTAIGPLNLGRLPKGESRPLTDREEQSLHLLMSGKPGSKAADYRARDKDGKVITRRRRSPAGGRGRKPE